MPDLTPDETAALAARRAETLEKDGTPADHARDGRMVVVADVSHPFDGGYLTSTFEVGAPGEKGRRVTRIDQDRCWCGRRADTHDARPARGDGRG